ncbi:MAG: two-component system response regulator, partial [Dokdonella sp.]
MDAIAGCHTESIVNVLIVDDQSSARTMLRHVVEGIDDGISVTDFADPLEALAWSVENVPDLLLLDYRMPGMDGLEFAKKFRHGAANRDVPIVLITAVDDEPVRQAALDVGVLDFLIKPVRPLELRLRCRNLLDLRQQGQSVKERARDLESQVSAGLAEIEQREREMLFRMARLVEYRDQGTGKHLLRMARYAEMIAEELGLSEEEVGIIAAAAPMHDIGKIGIPDAILHKPGKLTDDEWAIMRTHPQIGYDVMSNSQSRFIQMSAVISLGHHERWDGSGYPNGLVGDETPLPARIVALADVFDALLSERSYKRAWSYDEVAAYLNENSGTLFDPVCVKAVLAHPERVREIQNATLVPST